MTSHRWHLLGVGSIGGLFATHLATANIPVTLLLRNAGALARYHGSDGLRVHGPGHSHAFAKPPALAVDDTGDTRPVAILVTTKAPDTLVALAPLIQGDGFGQVVLLLQNGMGVSERVRERWPALRIWNAVTTAGVWRAGEFELHCVAQGETGAGRHDDAGDARCDDFVQALFASQLMQPSADIHAVLWRKLAVNACINALTAIHDCRNGELLEKPEAHARMARIAAEVERVAQADGVHLDTPVLAMAEAVCRLTAQNFSSMNRDVVAGRPTEIDFINGHVVSVAQRHGLAADENLAILHHIRELSSQRR
jgi:2-dehydropantoate 2-reductase